MDKIEIVIGGVVTEMDKEDVSKAIETGKIEVVNDDLVTYKKDEFETFKTNLANQEHKTGRLKGIEIYNKKFKEALGVEFDGKSVVDKDGNIDIDATALMISSNLSPIMEKKYNSQPNERIQELESDNDKLRENYQGVLNEFNTFKSNQLEKEVRTQKDAKILSFIPENGVIVSNDIAMIALKSKLGFDIEFDENQNILPTVNNVVKKDEKTLQPVDVKKFIIDGLTQLNLIKQSGGGNGDGDDPGGANTSTYDLFVKEMSKRDIKTGSQEFSVEMNKRIKEGSLKI